MRCITMLGQERCPRKAVMAVGTSRRNGDIRTTVYYDEGYAPTKADRLCREHGLHLLHELITVMVDEGTVSV